MAEGSRPTLKLKPASPAKPAPSAETPVYDPGKCSSLVGGVGLVQGKYAFAAHGNHQFLRELPKEQWYFLTPEQETNYRRQMAKQRQAINPISRGPAQQMPDKLIEIARENSRALAAELYAE